MMPRAYEPGERWHIEEGEMIVSGTGRELLALCDHRDETIEEQTARLVLAAESPLRDELLRKIEEWLAGVESEEPSDMADRDALLARIRAPRARTEGE